MSNTESRARLRLLDRVSREFEVFEQALAPASDPISAVLRTHLFTEQILEAHIRSWLEKAEKLLQERLSYRVKLELAGAFGTIEDRILDSLRALNKVRNDLAHKIDHDISQDDIEKIGMPLGAGFKRIKNDHPDDSATQLGKVLPYLAGCLVAQVRGPLESDAANPLKGGGRGQKSSKGK